MSVCLSKELTPAEETKQYRLLVVGADFHVHKTVSEVLSLECCEILYEESIDQFERVFIDNSPFDAVLIDLSEPAERFFELVSFVKERSPETEVIFASTLREIQLWLEAIQRGAYDFIPKPLDRRELHRIVQSAVGKTTQLD